MEIILFAVNRFYFTWTNPINVWPTWLAIDKDKFNIGSLCFNGREWKVHPSGWDFPPTLSVHWKPFSDKHLKQRFWRPDSHSEAKISLRRNVQSKTLQIMLNIMKIRKWSNRVVLLVLTGALLLWTPDYWNTRITSKCDDMDLYFFIFSIYLFLYFFTVHRVFLQNPLWIHRPAQISWLPPFLTAQLIRILHSPRLAVNPPERKCSFAGLVFFFLLWTSKSFIAII